MKVVFVADYKDFKEGQKLDLPEFALEEYLTAKVVVSPEEFEALQPEAVEPEAAEGNDLEGLAVKDLKAKAKELGLSGYSKLSKDDLITAIEGS